MKNKYYLKLKKDGGWTFARPGKHTKPFEFDTAEKAQTFGMDFYGYMQTNRWTVCLNPFFLED